MTLHRIANIAMLVAVVNFVAFAIGATYLGGDAVNGHAANGHYFLSNKGQVTEVSQTVFMYSKWHVFSVFITHPLAILLGILSRLDKG